MLALAVLLSAVQVVRASVPALAGPDVLGALVHDTTCLLAAGLVAWRAVVRRANRAAWACLAAGLGLYALGYVVFVWIVEPSDAEPFPSVADALWLALYPFAYLALVLLLRARVSRWHRSLWLDGIVAALGLAAFAVDTAFAHLLGGDDDRLWATLTNLVYPAADLVLLALVLASFAILGWRASCSLLLLGGGLLVLVCGDVAYLVQVSDGAQLWTTGTSATWLVAVVLMAAAAWCDRGDTPLQPSRGWMILLQPVFFLLSSAALLAKGALMTRRADIVVVVLAMAAVTAACGRIVLTYREVRALADAREQARTDELTGLANRRHLDQRLRELAGTGGDFGVLLIDLDRFKEVNDGFGHGVGDDLLVAVARRMHCEVGQADGLLARMGGDEFGVVLPGAGAAECAAVAQRLHTALTDAFEVGGMALHVEASVGAALSPDHGSDAGGLLRRADMAMYVAKRGRLGYHVFERGTEDDARLRLQTLEELRSALDGEEVVAHYQPQLDLRTGRVAGVEALARWQHPSRGLLGPATFLEVAEQTGLMRPLFVRIARCALSDARRWRDEGLALEVSVNVTAADVQDPTFPDIVAELLAEAGLPGAVLKVEVTEGVLMSSPERGRRVIDGLRALGVRLSLDDFGTGYSSLSYLPSLPVQELKLDRSFVAALTTDPRTAAVVRSTLDLAHQLGLESVAEGIEGPEALALLADYGCDVAQGYYIAKPMPADHLERWLVESPWVSGAVTVSGDRSAVASSA